MIWLQKALTSSLLQSYKDAFHVQVGSPEVIRSLAQRGLQIAAAAPKTAATAPCQSHSLVARMAGGVAQQPQAAARSPNSEASPGLDPPPHVARIIAKLRRFMEEHVIPAEPEIEVSVDVIGLCVRAMLTSCN